MDTKPLYIENQYLGRDRGWISVRILLALFCFFAYYLNLDNEKNNRIFLVAGCAILIVSLIMLFMVHYRITVTDNSIILSGLWTTRLVKIDLKCISKVERKPYSNFLINNPVYNLHQKGKIRFYAGGKEAVWITDRDGLIYIIGSRRAQELLETLYRAKNT